MRLSTILAGTVIAGTAMLGLAAPAFAGTVTTPTPTSAVTTPAAIPTVTVSPSWTPTGHPTDQPTGRPTGQPTDHKGDCRQGDQWSKNCDPHGNNNCREGDQWNRDTNKCDHGDNNCRQGDQWNTQQWNTQDNQWNRDHGKCDPQVDVCHFTRTQLPWGCINKCRPFPLVTTTAWNNQGPWVFENRCDNGDHNNRHPRNHCTNQLVVFNFPHNSSVLTETFGPRLQVNEVATYLGQTYVISGVWHTFPGHDKFTVSQHGHLVTNHGPSIWHGNAWVRVCTCTTR